MSSQLGIRPVDLRIVQIRLINPRPQIIRDKAGRDPAEELERRDVALGPRPLVHLQHGRTNMCREQASTITNACTVRSFPVTGSSQRPSCP